MKELVMKKYICSILIASLVLSPFFAQSENQEQSQIELPDLTTVISGDGSTEEAAPAPDFDDVLVLTYDSGNLTPVLPGEGQNDDSNVLEAGGTSSDKDIYADGQIGGGYPASFTGDFKISRIYGSDPFKISFNHNSTTGFAGHELAQGYKETNSAIGVEKDFIRSNIEWGLKAFYKDGGDGLQSKVDGLSSVNQDRVGLSAYYTHALPKGFGLNFVLDSQFYYRFVDITKGAVTATEVPEWIKKFSSITVDPALAVTWKYNGFETGFDAAYSLEAWDKTVHRGQFDLSFAWSNENLKISTKAGIVTGNSLGEHKVIVPFNLGLDTALPVYFSDRKLELSLNGGLASNRNSVSELEQKYKFTAMNDFASENSFWYGNIKLLIPLKTTFTGNVSAGYSRTVLNNGVWTPVYLPQGLHSGLYGFEQMNRNELYTDFAFTWKYKIFATTASYRANWLEVPLLEYKHSFSVNFSLQSQKGIWGADLKTTFHLDAIDKKPVIDMEGYMQVSPAVRICLSVDDLLKLLGAEERTYAGQYAANCGNAALLVKFLF